MIHRRSVIRDQRDLIDLLSQRGNENVNLSGQMGGNDVDLIGLFSQARGNQVGSNENENLIDWSSQSGRSSQMRTVGSGQVKGNENEDNGNLKDLLSQVGDYKNEVNEDKAVRALLQLRRSI